MYRVMNFMGNKGKIMEENGLEDVFVELNVYDPNVVQVILKRKSNNRKIRVERICEQIK